MKLSHIPYLVPPNEQTPSSLTRWSWEPWVCAYTSRVESSRREHGCRSLGALTNHRVGVAVKRLVTSGVALPKGPPQLGLGSVRK